MQRRCFSASITTVPKLKECVKEIFCTCLRVYDTIESGGTDEQSYVCIYSIVVHIKAQDELKRK